MPESDSTKSRIAAEQHPNKIQGSIALSVNPSLPLMTSTPSAAVPFIELLADTSKTPKALWIHPEAVDSSLLRHIAELETLRSLAGRITCVIDESDETDAALLARMTAAGCQTHPRASIHISPDGTDKAFPPSARWIGGDWWLASPTKPTAAQSASRALALQLVQLVSADADTHEIEGVLRRDPTLSYQLLRVVNSLGMGMSRQITSFSQAILIMGRSQLRRWLNLMLFSSRQSDDRSAMLLARVAVRSRCMELLAKASGVDKSSQEAAFMTGMFSLLGVLFGMPLADVLKPLKITDAMRSALLERTGELGALLDIVEGAEQGREPGDRLKTWHVAACDFYQLQLEAHLWMLDVIQEPGGERHA
jgi:hypothetical protein